MSRRRSPGEGSVWAYTTKAGETRWAIGYVHEAPDGSRRSVTRRRSPHGEKWVTRKDATTALRAVLAGADRGQHVDPSRQPLGAYLEEWVDGLRLRPGTVASYRRNLRLHVVPVLGAVPLSALTSVRISGLYRELERTGRKDQTRGHADRTLERSGRKDQTVKSDSLKPGLSPRTVRYVHTILSAALAAAVKDRRLARNPASDANPPTAREAKAPEMVCWTAPQLATFLAWSAGHSWYHPLWVVLASTGMRRGEALALRWRDVSLDHRTVTVRRSVGVVRNPGVARVLLEGDTKSGKPRVVDLDAATVAVLRTHRLERAGMALQLARDDALVFADEEGRALHPESMSRRFKLDTARCNKDHSRLNDQGSPRADLHDHPNSDDLPLIRLHALRHTHATALLLARVPVHVVSQRLGHASPTITMGVYAHVLPGNQREAADLFAQVIAEARPS